MCLGLPGRVVSVADGASTGLVNIAGVVRKIDLSLLSDPSVPGDYVLVHSGIAVERMSADQARQAGSLFEVPVTFRNQGPEDERFRT